MLFMVIERFKDGKAKEIYRRYQEKGRMMPEGLKYVDSWVEVNFNRCFQLMECDDLCLFQQWIVEWQDLGEFEIIPVVPSKETAEAITLIAHQELKSSQSPKTTLSAAEQAARKRFESHLGKIRVYPTGADNESIDADLAKEYADHQED